MEHAAEQSYPFILNLTDREWRPCLEADSGLSSLFGFDPSISGWSSSQGRLDEIRYSRRRRISLV
jgi:hypothetical protein